MQITRAGVTVQPLMFQFGVIQLSGGGDTTGGSTGGSSTGGGSFGGGGDTGSGGGFLPYVGGLFLALATGGILASTPPPSTPPAVAAGPVISAPGTSAGGSPADAPAPVPVAPGSQQARSTPAPIVLAASAAQAKPTPAPSTKGPGLVLPYTGANLWIPFVAGTGLIGLGVWLRRFAEGFKES